MEVSGVMKMIKKNDKHRKNQLELALCWLILMASSPLFAASRSQYTDGLPMIREAAEACQEMKQSSSSPVMQKKVALPKKFNGYLLESLSQAKLAGAPADLLAPVE